MCDEWRGRKGFARFLAYIGPRPAGCEIDRLDNTKGYEPGNVRWATPREQRANVRYWLNTGKRVRRAMPRRCALRTFERHGRIFGPRFNEWFADRLMDELEAEFGPRRHGISLTEVGSSIDEAFYDCEYSLESHHFEGLEAGNARFAKTLAQETESEAA